MKTICTADIKAMVNKFSLTEDETEYLREISDAVNNEKTSICKDIQETLLYGSWAKARDNAVKALIVYFASKAQKENDLRMAFDKTSWEIASKLKCGSYQVRLWLQGIAIFNDRFGKYVECSDRYGLNYLEVV